MLMLTNILCLGCIGVPVGEQHPQPAGGILQGQKSSSAIIFTCVIENLFNCVSFLSRILMSSVVFIVCF